MQPSRVHCVLEPELLLKAMIVSLDRVLCILFVTTALPLSGLTPAAASTPKVRIECGIPRREIVTCRLTGRGFRAREFVRIVYRITFTSLPRVHGKPKIKTFRRRAKTSATGAFIRPPLRFSVVRYHESFRLAVNVVGEHGDRATVTDVSIAQ